MGVKELWTILNPVKHQCHLSELRGKTLAVDLSGWVCEADGAKALSTAVAKPHLRNLFFRIYRLYGYGVYLIVVVDGEAIQLKLPTLDQRDKARKGCHGNSRKMTGHQRQLDSKIKECCQLLDVLGVPHLQAVGEADALCGLLSSKGIVDGVITQDSDVFLYGATTVYRDISTNEKSPQVDCYKAEDIKTQLGLSRSDLISLALLLGCDYCPHGVPGVGKETAMKLIRTCRSHDRSCDMLEVLRGWSLGKRDKECSTVELRVQRKAHTVSHFPNEAVISEYMMTSSRDQLPRERHLIWKCPDIKRAMLFCSAHLEWEAAYTREKMMTLITQWTVRERITTRGRGKEGAEDEDSCRVRPINIVCSRVRQFVACYQVKWEGLESVIGDEDCPTSDSSPSLLPTATKSKWVEFITIENSKQFSLAYPELSSKFEEEKEVKKAASKKKHKKRVQKQPPSSTSIDSDHPPSDSSHLVSPTKQISSTLRTLTLATPTPTPTTTTSNSTSHQLTSSPQDEHNQDTVDSGQDSEGDSDEAPLPLMKRLQSSGRTLNPVQDRFNHIKSVQDSYNRSKVQQDEIAQDSLKEVLCISDSESVTNNSNDVISDEDDVIEITASPKRPCPNSTRINDTTRTQMLTFSDIETPPTTNQAPPTNSPCTVQHQMSHDYRNVSHDMEAEPHDYQHSPKHSKHTPLCPSHHLSSFQYSTQPSSTTYGSLLKNTLSNSSSVSPTLSLSHTQQQIHLANTMNSVTPKPQTCSTSKESMSLSQHCETGCGTVGTHTSMINTSSPTPPSQQCVHFKEISISPQTSTTCNNLSRDTDNNCCNDQSSCFSPPSFNTIKAAMSLRTTCTPSGNPQHCDVSSTFQSHSGSLEEHSRLQPNLAENVPAPVWTTKRNNKHACQSGSSPDCPIVIS